MFMLNNGNTEEWPLCQVLMSITRAHLHLRLLYIDVYSVPSPSTIISERCYSSGADSVAALTVDEVARGSDAAESPAATRTASLSPLSQRTSMHSVHMMSSSLHCEHANRGGTLCSGTGGAMAVQWLCNRCTMAVHGLLIQRTFVRIARHTTHMASNV